MSYNTLEQNLTSGNFHFRSMNYTGMGIHHGSASLLQIIVVISLLRHRVKDPMWIGHAMSVVRLGSQRQCILIDRSVKSAQQFDPQAPAGRGGGAHGRDHP